MNESRMTVGSTPSLSPNPPARPVSTRSCELRTIRRTGALTWPLDDLSGIDVLCTGPAADVLTGRVPTTSGEHPQHGLTGIRDEPGSFPDVESQVPRDDD